MNILPKKRWHVRNRENIARVRRDEAAAAEEEKEKERRKRLAEQEAKIELMRKQTKEKYNLSDELTHVAVSPSKEQGHVNFFKDIEEGAVVTDAKNKEHEQEIKDEKEKYEKQIGYLTYLGQDTNEATGKVSWYNRPRTTSLLNNDEDECDLRKKSKLDPVCSFKTVFRRHDFSLAKKSAEESKTMLIKKVKKQKKEKKNKHKNKKRNQISSSDSSSSSDSEGQRMAKKKELQILRLQRLKREREEKLRADRLLAKMRGDIIPESTKEPPQFTQKYNSQFNPHLARQNNVN